MTETVLLLQNNWTLRSDAGDNVRICQPNGAERVYWDSNEWHEDPIGVMGAIFGAAASLPSSRARGPRDVPESEWRSVSEGLPLGAWIEPANDDEWVVNIPPRGPQDYEGDAILAPYGDTYWGDLNEAVQFVAKVAAEPKESA